MQPDMDLFVVTRRIAADHERARAERLARERPGVSRRARARVWLGRRLVAAGAFVAGDPVRAERSTAADRPC
jgi:hypothetical protein